MLGVPVFRSAFNRNPSACIDSAQKGLVGTTTAVNSLLSDFYDRLYQGVPLASIDIKVHEAALQELGQHPIRISFPYSAEDITDGQLSDAFERACEKLGSASEAAKVLQSLEEGKDRWLSALPLITGPWSTQTSGLEGHKLYMPTPANTWQSTETNKGFSTRVRVAALGALPRLFTAIDLKIFAFDNAFWGSPKPTEDILRTKMKDWYGDGDINQVNVSS